MRIARYQGLQGKFAEPILQGRMIPKGFPANLAKVARRKLIMVDSADLLEALNSPSGDLWDTVASMASRRHACWNVCMLHLGCTPTSSSHPSS
jgi:proteic killer suppression protein